MHVVGVGHDTAESSLLVAPSMLGPATNDQPVPSQRSISGSVVEPTGALPTAMQNVGLGHDTPERAPCSGPMTAALAALVRFDDAGATLVGVAITTPSSNPSEPTATSVRLDRSLTKATIAIEMLRFVTPGAPATRWRMGECCLVWGMGLEPGFVTSPKCQVRAGNPSVVLWVVWATCEDQA